MSAHPRYAPRLDPASVVALQAGRIPRTWLSSGHCQACGPVLLAGTGRDYGVLPYCLWCGVRQQGGRLPPVALIQARLREQDITLPPYLQQTPPSMATAGVTAAPALSSNNPPVPTPATVSKTDTPCLQAQDGQIRPRLDASRVDPPARQTSERPHPSGPHTDSDEPVGHIREVPHHPQDLRWIEEQLATLPNPVARSQARRRYGMVFQAAFEAESHPIRKEGKARFAANTDLRNHLEQHTPEESSRG